MRGLADDDGWVAVLRRLRLEILDDDRLACLVDVPPEADQRDGDLRDIDAALDAVGEADHLRLRVVDCDVDDLGVEDVPDLVANERVHPTHLQLLGQALLDAVDDREFGGTLVGLGEEALRLVEQAGVLGGDAEAGSQRGEESHVGF